MPESSKKIVLHIENLDCPVCAQALQADLAKIKGVDFVAVDYVSQTITLQTSEDKAIQKVIATANKFEEVRVLDGGRYAAKRRNNHLKEWLQILISALFFVMGLVFETLFNTPSFSLAAYKVLAYCAYAIAYFAVGYPVLISTVKNVAKGRIFDENFLMTLASIGAVVIGEYFEAVLVMLLYQLGELLQAIAVGSSRQSVTKLMELKSERATLLFEDEQKEIPPEEVKIGDILLVKAGEKVPVDGILLSEKAHFDTKSLTGESEPKTITKDGEVLSGYVNAGDVFKMQSTREYTDSAVGRILDMMENASSGKAKPEKFIAKFARVYTPIVCLLALAIAIFAPFAHGLVAGYGFVFYQPLRWLQSALTFLVISCPCALIISVPLTYFSGIGACAKNGILVKGATHLDVIAKARVIAFDKTGTLTEGKFSIQSIAAAQGDAQSLLSIVAAIERNSAHPIAKAFEGEPTKITVDKTEEIAGKGLRAQIGEDVYLVGNAQLLADEQVAFAKADSINTLVYIAKNKAFLGVIEVGDALRQGVQESVGELKKLGLKESIMLTGDNAIRAEKIAKAVGLDGVKAELLPDEKLQLARSLKEKGVLLYVGDGINDAPVMMAADCSVSMGKLGSAAAIEASDMVLISDDITALPKGVRIAKKTRLVVLQNIIFSIAMKLGFMALGALGVLPLWLAVFADVGVMLLAVFNSFRVRFIKTSKKK
jgi:Cd2+/Zn2+-exporting ATPase